MDVTLNNETARIHGKTWQTIAHQRQLLFQGERPLEPGRGCGLGLAVAPRGCADYTVRAGPGEDRETRPKRIGTAAFQARRTPDHSNTGIRDRETPIPRDRLLACLFFMPKSQNKRSRNGNPLHDAPGLHRPAHRGRGHLHPDQPRGLPGAQAKHPRNRLALSRPCRIPWSSLPLTRWSGPKKKRWRWLPSGCTKPLSPRPTGFAPKTTD